MDLSRPPQIITIDETVPFELEPVNIHSRNWLGKNTVEIRINAKNGELSETIRETIQAKVANLPRLFNRTTGIQVLADLKNSANPKVEIIISAEETNDFFASNTGANVLAALDLTISKMEQQLRKHKEKLTEHRGHPKNSHEIE